MDKLFVLCLVLIYACAEATAHQVSEDPKPHHHYHHHHEKKHKAHSFQHFHGPVHGHHEEITWQDKHGHKYHDFVAHPKYKFHYGVHDHHTHDIHGQSEHRDGDEVHGEYHLHEPGGNVRTVKYYADKHGGFFAEVHNNGGNDHSGYGR